MSFNIRMLFERDEGYRSWEQRGDITMNVIRLLAPDVLALQEVGAPEEREEFLQRIQIDDLRAAFPNMGFIGAEPGTPRPHKNPIMYRLSRFESLEDGYFVFSENPRDPRSRAWGARRVRFCTWARFRDRSTGRSFYLYNVHLDNLSSRSRRKSAHLLAGEIASRAEQDDPVIVAGDFNTFADSPSLNRLAEMSLRHAVEDPETGTYHFFRGVTLWPAIDHILVDTSMTIHRGWISYYREDKVFPSDHFPVLADVGFRED